MELLIKIDEKDYKALKNGSLNICKGMRSGKTFLVKILDAIDNGIVLPDNHGDLVDVNELEGGYTCIIGLDIAHACVKDCQCSECGSGVYQLDTDIKDLHVIAPAYTGKANE